jgi:acetyl-CoA carboxylase/biotin carboxylase 1
MRPTFHHLLELARLSANFELERIPAIGKTPKSTLDPKIGETCVVHPQVVSFVESQYWSCYEYWCPAALQQGLDELERAQGNSKVSLQSSSRIFLHALHELEGTTPQELATRFKAAWVQ